MGEPGGRGRVHHGTVTRSAPSRLDPQDGSTTGASAGGTRSRKLAVVRPGDGPRYGAEHRPLVLAHRGGVALGPENTLVTFERSLNLGIGYLETDVRVTSDGVPLAFHDATLDRVTKLNGPVERYTWAQLKGTKVRHPSGEKAPIAKLEKVLGAFPEACFTIDIKSPRSIGPTIHAINKTRSAGRVCVAGGWDTWLAAVSEATGCAQALGWRSLTQLLSAAKMGRRPSRAIATGGFAHVAWRLGHPILGASLAEHPRVCERLVGSAHDLGIKLMVWTVNDSKSMRRLLDQGVDGIFTDRPDRARELMIRRGEWSPMGA